MLTRTGPKLLDFGVAKLRSTTSGFGDGGDITRAKTAEGTIVGTVGYMAPEQLEGRDVDARTDIWALGVVLYEMVTGKRPFAGTSPASIVAAILKDDPAPTSATQPLAPAALDHVVSTALAKDPDARWQSAADVATELRRIGRGATAPSLPSPRRRSRLAMAGWAVAAAAGIVLAMQGSRPAPSAPSETIQFDIQPPADTLFSTFRRHRRRVADDLTRRRADRLRCLASRFPDAALGSPARRQRGDGTGGHRRRQLPVLGARQPAGRLLRRQQGQDRRSRRRRASRAR